MHHILHAIVIAYESDDRGGSSGFLEPLGLLVIGAVIAATWIDHNNKKR